MSNKNIVSKLYLSLFLIAGITIIMALFTSYSDIVIEKNNKKIHELNEKMIFFEKIMIKHESYVKEMLNSIIFQDPFIREINPQKCSLGKWYYSTIKSDEFKQLPYNIRKAVLSIEDDHMKLHNIGAIIKNEYTNIDKALKNNIMQLKLYNLRLETQTRKHILNKLTLTNIQNNQILNWWNNYKKTKQYVNLTTPKIKQMIKVLIKTDQQISDNLLEMIKLEKETQYNKAYNRFTQKFFKKSSEQEQLLNNLIVEINLVDEHNKKIREQLSQLVPPALQEMKSGLKPYQSFLEKQRNNMVSQMEQNASIMDIISLLLTAINILILLAVGYWIRYSLVNKINYLRAKYKELEDTQEQLIESEKMASLGGMVAGVAHEINTPIGMALTAITSLEDETKNLNKLYNDEEMSEEDFEDFLKHSIELNKSINININKAATLVKSFKQVAVDQTGSQDRKFNFAQYVEEILQSLSSQLKKTKITIELDIDNDLEIYSNPGAFSQILSNFIMNSIIHGFDEQEKGTIKIITVKEGEDFILEYKDNGKGVDEHTLAKIYDPFYTTNRANGGSGLGMNIVFNLVTQKLHGKITLKSKPNNGIHFTIKAPVHYKNTTKKT
ncbi:MAG: ATP-binding protein [Campylobacterota bacterium]|nr:ATP-binding protein [Campylobacterota bacterium]